MSATTHNLNSLFDTIGELDNTIKATSFIRALLANQADPTSINPDEMYYLLDLIVEKQSELTDKMQTIARKLD